MKYRVTEVDGFEVTQDDNGEVVGVVARGRASDSPPREAPDVPIGKIRASEFAQILQQHLAREITPLVEQVRDLERRVKELEASDE